MGAFSSLIGWLAGKSGANSAKRPNGLMAVFSVVAIVIGGVWLFSET